jgi:hypothetical protein
MPFEGSYLKRKCHMRIPHFVFHKMENEFGDLAPLFLKFTHSNIDMLDIRQIVNKVDSSLAAGTLKPHTNPYKKASSVKTALNEACRSTSGEKKLAEIEEIYKKSCANCRTAFLKAAQERCDLEVDNSDFDTSWRDLTAIYPDKFDGDNITVGNFHSCKFKDITNGSDNPVWEKGHVCHSIQALTWRIAGLYKEFCMEPDVMTSEKSKMTLVEDMIRLSHYVLDSSTIVHLMSTGSDFHNVFEADLDEIIDNILPDVKININKGVQSAFSYDAYGEADKRAKITFKRFYFRVLEAYGIQTRYDKPKAKQIFCKGTHLDLVKDIIQNACQNLADFWMYTIEMCNLENTISEYVKETGGQPST